MKLTKVTRSVTADVIALVAVSVLGVTLQVTQHVPLALTFVQVIGLELLILAWPIAALRYDKHKHKVRDTHDRQVIFEIVLFGLLTAGFAFLNYLYFFMRHGLSPAYIDTGNELYLQATTVTLLTLALCQSVHLLFVRADAERHLTLDFVLSNTQLLKIWGVSLFALLNLAYNPLFQAIFRTRPIDPLDWLSAMAFAGVYFALKLVQRHTREHTRHAVVKLHQELDKDI